MSKLPFSTFVQGRQEYEVVDKVARSGNLINLTGKKIAIIGDSLSVPGTWANSFAEMLSGIATVDNKSVTAKTMNWLHDDGYATILGNNNYDIIIIELGINNWSLSTPLGSFSLNPQSNVSFDDALVNGYKDLLSYYGTTKCPEVFYITPFPITYTPKQNNLKYTPDVYRKCIASFAKVVGARFINGDCIPKVSNGITDITKNLYQSDGIHFTANYNKTLAEYILAKILTGGDSAISDSDGVVIDLSSYATSKFNGTIKCTIDGHGTHVKIQGSVTGPFTIAGTVIAQFPLDVANLIKNTASTIEILPMGVYGVNNSAPNPAIAASAYFVSGTDLYVNLGNYSGQSVNVGFYYGARSTNVYMESFEVS